MNVKNDGSITEKLVNSFIKKSVDNQGLQKKISPEHDQFIRDLVDNDPQISAEGKHKARLYALYCSG